MPFVTYAVSGLGSTERDYAAACPGARIGAGLAVRGEEVAQHRADVETWLRRAGCSPDGSHPPRPTTDHAHRHDATARHERNDHGQAASRQPWRSQRSGWAAWA